MASRTEAELAQAVAVRAFTELFVVINESSRARRALGDFLAAAQMAVTVADVEERAEVIAISKRLKPR